MLLDKLLHSLIQLRDIDGTKAAYFIAKELVLIDLNIIWNPHKVADDKARLMSLAQHVQVTFKDQPEANEIIRMIKKMASRLDSSQK